MLILGYIAEKNGELKGSLVSLNRPRTVPKACDKLTLNHRVPGSSPGAPTKLFKYLVSFVNCLRYSLARPIRESAVFWSDWCVRTPPLTRRTGLPSAFHRLTTGTLHRAGGRGWVNGGGRPAGQGPSGSSAPGKLRKRSASGHAAANARRMRLAVSTTRAAIFKRRRRSVANSAVANSRTLGMASRTVSISQ